MTETAAQFDAACQQVEEVLNTSTREAIAGQLARVRDDPATALRRAMELHRFRTAGNLVDLSDVVRRLDEATRTEGFHILHAWDPVAHEFRSESAPVLLLKHVRPTVGANVVRELILQLDTYFLFLLSLLVMRVWDAADPDAALDRVSGLLDALQGPRGSGRWFVDDAPTLLSLAIAQYQPDEQGYDALLARIKQLHPRHQLQIAAINASNFGAHLRWGARHMYADVERMRSDNVVDYPWVLHAALTLLREYERGGDQMPGGRLTEGVLQILSPDPRALIVDREPPHVLAHLAEEHAECVALIARHRDRLMTEFGELGPRVERYSPLGFHYNFLHNVLTAVLALTLSEPTPNLSLNALLYSSKEKVRLADSPDLLAHQLTTWASHPSRVTSSGAPLMLQDIEWGQHCCAEVRAALGA